MVVINVVYTYFKADKGTIDALAPQGENSCEGAGGGGTAGELALATSLLGFLDDDNIGVTRNRPRS